MFVMSINPGTVCHCFKLVVNFVICRVLRILIAVNTFFAFCRSLAYLSYYTLNLNSSNLGGNIYINCAVAALVDMASASCMGLMLAKLGRRHTCVVCYLLSGMLCLGTPVLKSGEWNKYCLNCNLNLWAEACRNAFMLWSLVRGWICFVSSTPQTLPPWTTQAHKLCNGG